jgi:hypothetical protein
VWHYSKLVTLSSCSKLLFPNQQFLKMADAINRAEKVQDDHVETIPEKDVPTPSSADEAAAAAQRDDPLEAVSVSTIMAIFVSSDLPTHIPFPLT